MNRSCCAVGGSEAVWEAGWNVLTDFFKLPQSGPTSLDHSDYCAQMEETLEMKPGFEHHSCQSDRQSQSSSRSSEQPQTRLTFGGAGGVGNRCGNDEELGMTHIMQRPKLTNAALVEHEARASSAFVKQEVDGFNSFRESVGICKITDDEERWHRVFPRMDNSSYYEQEKTRQQGATSAHLDVTGFESAPLNFSEPLSSLHGNAMHDLEWRMHQREQAYLARVGLDTR